MLRKLELIAFIPTEIVGLYVAYFLNKDQAKLLILNVDQSEVEEVLGDASDNLAQPDIHKVFLDTANFLGARFSCAVLYFVKNGNYQTYLRLTRGEDTYDINCSFLDALKLCFNAEVNLYAKDEILQENGIKVSKELIEILVDGKP